MAGRQLAADDERNMWPATRDVIRHVRPDNVLLENVPGLLVCGYAAVVTADLAEMGYVGRAGCLSASQLGADHVRERWWVRAHSAALRRGEGKRRQVERGRQLRAGALGRANPWPSSIHDNEIRSRFVRVVDGMAHRVERLGCLGNGQVPAVVARAWEELAA
jgi:DNA (cytosine-5)-methyltransferase 1